MQAQSPLLYPDATEEFLDWGRETNRFHGTTPNLYRQCLKSLQARYPERPVEDVMQLDPILGFLRDRGPVGAPGNTENTVDAYLRAFKAFSRYGARKGWCVDLRDPLTDAFKVKARTRRLAHWLSPADLTRIVGSCPATQSGQRDAMLVRFAALTGLRRSEIAASQWRHVDFSGRTLWVPKGKGDKERYVGLMPQAVEYLQEWRDVAAHQLGAFPLSHHILPTIVNGDMVWDRPAKVWYAQRHQPTGPFWGMSDVLVGQRVREAGERAGFEHLGAHDLRRTHAGILEDLGMPIQEISRQLGHADVSTTMRYLEANPKKRADALASLQVAF